MEEHLSSGISRRSALKRIGAGAAIAWTAPVLMSMNAKAFALGSAPPCTPGTTCGKGGPCTCYAVVEGGTICVPGRRCGGSDCTTSADCGSGKVCAIDNLCSGERFCTPTSAENGCIH